MMNMLPLLCAEDKRLQTTQAVSALHSPHAGAQEAKQQRSRLASCQFRPICRLQKSHLAAEDWIHLHCTPERQ